MKMTREQYEYLITALNICMEAEMDNCLFADNASSSSIAIYNLKMFKEVKAVVESGVKIDG